MKRGPSTSSPLHGQQGRDAIAALKQARIANLCDLVSEGIQIKQAAKLVGITISTATEYMAQVRRELGWQAQ